MKAKLTKLTEREGSSAESRGTVAVYIPACTFVHSLCSVSEKLLNEPADTFELLTRRILKGEGGVIKR